VALILMETRSKATYYKIACIKVALKKKFYVCILYLVLYFVFLLCVHDIMICFCLIDILESAINQTYCLYHKTHEIKKELRLENRNLSCAYLVILMIRCRVNGPNLRPSIRRDTDTKKQEQGFNVALEIWLMNSTKKQQNGSAKITVLYSYPNLRLRRWFLNVREKSTQRLLEICLLGVTTDSRRD
jgi:hypothetical protein